jgi:type II secretion system protein I
VTAPERAGRRDSGHGAGFTLLEVLVALAVVGVAVAGVLQLASQSLRLLRLTSEHVAAVNLADRLAREASPASEEVEQGNEGPFTWERRVLPVETPRDLDRAAGQNPRLVAIGVAVRWGASRVVEVATMRTEVPAALAPTTPGQTGPPPGTQVTPQGLPGQSGRGPGPGSSSGLGSGLGTGLGSGPGQGPGSGTPGPRRSTPGSSGLGSSGLGSPGLGSPRLGGPGTR